MPDVVTLHYGSGRDQFARLHLPDAGRDTGPDSPADGSAHGAPVAVVIHGGFWRQRYGVDLAEPLADDLARHGVAALAVEYRRIGPGGRGGWPQTADDVAAAVDLLADGLPPAAGEAIDTSRVAVVGHSAGGQLATWLAHRARRGGTRIAIRGAVSQAGVLDLVAAATVRLGRGAVTDFLGGTPRRLAGRYRQASPIALVGDGTPVVCIHGDADAAVPIDMSRSYTAAAVTAGDPVELVTIPGGDHMGLIDPTGRPWRICRDRLIVLLGSSRTAGR